MIDRTFVRNPTSSIVPSQKPSNIGFHQRLKNAVVFYWILFHCHPRIILLIGGYRCQVFTEKSHGLSIRNPIINILYLNYCNLLTPVLNYKGSLPKVLDLTASFPLLYQSIIAFLVNNNIPVWNHGVKWFPVFCHTQKW